jgi:hypothetical protein
MLLHEGKEPSSSAVIVDDVPKEMKNQNKEAPKTTKGFFYWTQKSYQYTFREGCDYTILSQALGV